MAFYGTFDHTLDAKGRLTIPSRFRAAFAAGAVVAIGSERCLEVWRPADYDAVISSALAGLNPLSPQAREIQRAFSTNASESEPDNAGRIVVPPKLAAHAAISKEVVVTGSGPCLEIWDRDAFTPYNDSLIARIPELTASLGHPA